MTVLDDRQLMEWPGACARPAVRRRTMHYGPAIVRPTVAPLQYRGNGVRLSRAVHTRRPVSTTVSVGLACVAALITLWLGFLGHFSGGRAVAAVPAADQLAVVQVRAGETLGHLAARVAPGAPTAQVVQRILELNELDSASVEAGQTLIAPVG
ncbi:MAG: LysM peptidoglycan-binding domain-containing protein [Mycobacterium sp.]|nr:LysM peptidoglycan-binding domain-containing protein [Mycobacterium sp.]